MITHTDYSLFSFTLKCFVLFNFQGARQKLEDEFLVGPSGIEPPTSRLSGARSNQLSYEPLRLAAIPYFLVSLPLHCLRSPRKLSSLSRHLHNVLALGAFICTLEDEVLGHLRRFLATQATFCASAMEMMGFEPMTPCLQGRCSPN